MTVHIVFQLTSHELWRISYSVLEGRKVVCVVPFSTFPAPNAGCDGNMYFASIKSEIVRRSREVSNAPRPPRNNISTGWAAWERLRVKEWENNDIGGWSWLWDDSKLKDAWVEWQIWCAWTRVKMDQGYGGYKLRSWVLFPNFHHPLPANDFLLFSNHTLSFYTLV